MIQQFDTVFMMYIVTFFLLFFSLFQMGSGVMVRNGFTGGTKISTILDHINQELQLSIKMKSNQRTIINLERFFSWFLLEINRYLLSGTCYVHTGIEVWKEDKLLTWHTWKCALFHWLWLTAHGFIPRPVVRGMCPVTKGSMLKITTWIMGWSSVIVIKFKDCLGRRNGEFEAKEIFNSLSTKML